MGQVCVVASVSYGRMRSSLYLFRGVERRILPSLFLGSRRSHLATCDYQTFGAVHRAWETFLDVKSLTSR